MTATDPTMQCLLCDRKLEPAFPEGGGTFQPYNGGEIRFIFAFGSCKFDYASGCTTFQSVVCDDCAEKYVDRMTMSLTDMNGRDCTDSA